MSNKQTEQFLQDIAEVMEQEIFKCRELSRRLVEFQNETVMTRTALARKLHEVQAELLSPELQKSTEEEDQENPSEGTPWHPKHV